MEFTGLTLRFKFTPNHRMICTHYLRRTKKWAKMHVKETYKINIRDKFPVSSKWEDGSYKLDPNEPSNDMCELLGWICSEGHFNKYSINIVQSLTKNKSNVDRIDNLLKRLDIPYRQYIHHGRYKNKDKITRYTMATFSLNWQESKVIIPFIPQKKPTWHMLLWSKEGIRRFIESFTLGDGHFYRAERFVIYQKDQKVLDILQALIFRLGYRAMKTYRKDNCGGNVYACDKKLSSARSSNSKQKKRYLNIKTTFYKGKVWCPQTPSGTFIARRNGRIIITGNSFHVELPLYFLAMGCPKDKDAVVFDPFLGTGTTLEAACMLGVNGIGVELSKDYILLIEKRLKPYISQLGLFTDRKLIIKE